MMNKSRRLKQSQSVIGLFRALGADAADIPRIRPIYRRVVDVIEHGISRHALLPGFQLPPERDLAAALRMSRATVVAAYRELEARGLVRAYVGRGTFVCARPDPGSAPFAWRGKVSATALQSADSTVRDLVGHAADAAVVSFAAGQPALECFPVDAFRAAVDLVLTRDSRAALRLGATEGQPRFRAAIAERFGGNPENVLVLAGARLVGWDIRRADLDELEELLVRYRPKLMYFNPTYQNPTGTTLPIRTRRELIELAERYRVPIIEDDTYRELTLTRDPPPSLYELDEVNAVVIRLHSFAKMLAPGLRLGWISAVPAIVDQLTRIKQRVDPHTQNLAQLAVAELLETGVFDRHLAALRGEHLRRRDAMMSAFRQNVPAGKMRFAVPEGGLYFWCEFDVSVRAASVCSEALGDGVAFVAGEHFYVDHGGAHEMRVCFTAQPPEQSIKAARSLARSIAAVERQGGSRSAPAPIP